MAIYLLINNNVVGVHSYGNIYHKQQLDSKKQSSGKKFILVERGKWTSVSMWCHLLSGDLIKSSSCAYPYMREDSSQMAFCYRRINNYYKNSYVKNR